MLSTQGNDRLTRIGPGTPIETFSVANGIPSPPAPSSTRSPSGSSISLVNLSSYSTTARAASPRRPTVPSSPGRQYDPPLAGQTDGQRHGAGMPVG